MFFDLTKKKRVSFVLFFLRNVVLAPDIFGAVVRFMSEMEGLVCLLCFTVSRTALCCTVHNLHAGRVEAREGSVLAVLGHPEVDRPVHLVC